MPAHRSIKLFTVYDKVRIGDETILDVLWYARFYGTRARMALWSAFMRKNDGLIRWMTRKLVEAVRPAPRHHPLSHPRAAEIEALNRMCLFCEYTGQPVMLFHISTGEGVAVVREARARGVRVLAEMLPDRVCVSNGSDQNETADAAFRCMRQHQLTQQRVGEIAPPPHQRQSHRRVRQCRLPCESINCRQRQRTVSAGPVIGPSLCLGHRPTPYPPRRDMLSLTLATGKPERAGTISGGVRV